VTGGPTYLLYDSKYRHRGSLPLRYGPCFSTSTVRHACPICFGLSPFPITYSPCFSSYYPLALLSGQLSRHFPLDIKHRPTQCCPRHYTQFIIYVVLEVVTMAMVGTTVVLPTYGCSFVCYDSSYGFSFVCSYPGSMKFCPPSIHTNGRITP
jgi:hypothetical protein